MVTMDGFWGPLPLFSGVKGFSFFSFPSCDDQSLQNVQGKIVFSKNGPEEELIVAYSFHYFMSPLC